MSDPIHCVKEGRIRGGDDTETLTLRQGGHVLTIEGCPPARNRIEPGIREVLRLSRLTADARGTWDDFRAWASEVGVLVDPLDDQGEETEEHGRYAGPVSSGLVGGGGTLHRSRGTA